MHTLSKPVDSLKEVKTMAKDTEKKTAALDEIIRSMMPATYFGHKGPMPLSSISIPSVISEIGWLAAKEENDYKGNRKMETEKVLKRLMNGKGRIEKKKLIGGLMDRFNTNYENAENAIECAKWWEAVGEKEGLVYIDLGYNFRDLSYAAARYKKKKEYRG